VTPADLSIQQLRDDLSGEVIAPSDASYDESRSIYFKGIDLRPAAVARVAGTEDVVRVVSAARDSGLELSVRSGGHNPNGWGTSEGGIVLDLSGLKGIEIDAESRTAWAETGMTAAEYATAAGEHDLVTGFGDAGSVGIGGITLGGGVGFLLRKHGLTIDDLLAAEIVTANGQVLDVDAENHPDLFWAIRGGGGNFGVATRLKFRLHELPEIVGGMIMLPATPELVAEYFAAAEAAPEELSTIANVMLAPPMPFVPAEHHGKPVIMGLIVYAGPAADGEDAIAPFRELAEPLADMIGPKPYAGMYEGPEPPPAVTSSAKNMFVNAIDRDAAAAIIEQLPASTAQRSVTQFRILGGAMARVPADATAYAHRDKRAMANVATLYEDPAEAPTHQAWVASLADALDDGAAGAYVNFIGEDSEATVRGAYPGSTWDRLAEIKGRYDPDNLFSRNANIPPA